MRKLILIPCAVVFAASPAVAQPRSSSGFNIVSSNVVIGSANKPATLIRNGRIFTVGAAGTIPNGDILIQNGKIELVVPHVAELPATMAGVKIIDAHGKPVTPGLMVSATQLGIDEIDLVAESNDSGPGLDYSKFDADGYTAGPKAYEKAASAAFDVSDAINPSSTLIPVARIAGVTRSATTPSTGGGVFRGQAAIINLGNGANLLDKAKAGMVVDISTGNGDSRPMLWSQLRETLDDAREYWADRAGYHRPGGARDQRTSRIDLDALEPVIHGREPLIVNVNRASDIHALLQYCQTNKLKLIVLGGQEAWEVAGELAAAHVPVVLDSEQNLPGSFSGIGGTLKNAARLDAAGVTVVFQPQGGTAHYARTITQVAGNAVANGMKWDHALAAITKNPAQVWGIGDSYGTLEPGKDADVVIWDGDPLDVTSAPTAVFIKGVEMPMISRQTELRDRYKHLEKKTPPFPYR